MYASDRLVAGDRRCERHPMHSRKRIATYDIGLVVHLKLVILIDYWSGGRYSDAVLTIIASVRRPRIDRPLQT
ncbi:hypothetical protein ASF14_20200 [Sphingomonas sp. Leaf257]|nr:hypothetical protein ASF14_20200 [Sphingomonas sp. Leaf257]